MRIHLSMLGVVSTPPQCYSPKLLARKARFLMYVRYSSLYLPYLGISEHSLLGIRAPPQDSVVPVLDGTNLPMGYSRKEDQDRLCRTRQDVQQTPEKGQGLHYTYSG